MRPFHADSPVSVVPSPCHVLGSELWRGQGPGPGGISCPPNIHCVFTKRPPRLLLRSPTLSPFPIFPPITRTRENGRAHVSSPFKPSAGSQFTANAGDDTTASILVYCVHSNKISQMWWLKTIDIYSVTLLRLEVQSSGAGRAMFASGSWWLWGPWLMATSLSSNRLLYCVCVSSSVSLLGPFVTGFGAHPGNPGWPFLPSFLLYFSPQHLLSLTCVILLICSSFLSLPGE